MMKSEIEWWHSNQVYHVKQSNNNPSEPPPPPLSDVKSCQEGALVPVYACCVVYVPLGYQGRLSDGLDRYRKERHYPGKATK